MTKLKLITQGDFLQSKTKVFVILLIGILLTPVLIVNSVAYDFDVGVLPTSLPTSPYPSRPIISSLSVQTFLDRDFEGFSHFFVNVSLDPYTKNLTASMDLLFFNNDNYTITNLYFHLYPNAYSNEDLIPSNMLSDMYPGGFDAGWIIIDLVTDGTNNLIHTITGQDNTILNVSLVNPIAPNSTSLIHIEFHEKVPRCLRRFGYYTMNDKTVFAIANWIPMPAVYDKLDGWNLDPFYYTGDPFYSDAAYFDVNITVPSSMTVGSTGNLTSVTYNNSLKTYHWHTSLVRDFAWCASEDYYSKIVTYNNINVTYLYLDESSSYSYRANLWTAPILSTYEDYYGSYPYEDLTVAETFLAYGGMEYPQIVFIRAFLRSPDVVVAHEIAHQWFYGIIGNDEIDEPFLDEGFAAYSESLFTRAYSGDSAGDEYIANDRNNVNYYYQNGFTGKINQSTADYPADDWSYGLLAYTKMAVVIEMLRQTLGDTIFKEALHLYYNTYKYHNAFTINLEQCVEAVTHSDFSWFFDQWLNTETLPYYSMTLKSFKELSPGEYKITIELSEDIAFKNLLPIGIVDKNATTTIYRVWLNDTNKKEFSFVYHGHPISIKLDPKECFLMMNDDIEIMLPYPHTSTTHTVTVTLTPTTTNTSKGAIGMLIYLISSSAFVLLALLKKRKKV